MNTLSRNRLVHKLVEGCVVWRETCGRVDDAYRYWTNETGPRDGVAFGRYMAALDAEERAAKVYAGLVGAPRGCASGCPFTGTGP
jgi:hypothetical protein